MERPRPGNQRIVLRADDWRTEITQLAVSRSRRTGAGHMMLAQNPVYLIVGEGE